MKNNPLLFLLFLLMAFGQVAQAQSLLPCPPPSPGSPPLVGALKCTSTCIWCNLNGVTDRNNVFLPAGANESVCLNAIPITNPRWYGFIAGSTTLTIVITPSNCVGANGLEASIVRDCGAFFVTCVPGTLGGAGTPVILNANNLVVGQAYQLLVDGMEGDVCDFTISTFNGTTIPPPLGPIGTIEGLTQVCPKGTVTYTIPPVDNAVSYTWTSPAGSKINGFGNSLTLPASTGNSVDITFAGLGGTICVSASNACSPPVQSCISVTNAILPIVDLPDAVVCFQEVPYAWPEAPNTILAAPGTYTLVSSPYPSYIGCDSIVRQKVKVLPLNIKTLPTIYLCQGETYTINGFPYTQSGSYQEILTTDNGCDSIVNFNIVVIPINAVAQQPDTITCAVTSVPLSGVGSTTGNSVLYQWTNSSGQVVSNAITATAMASGDYFLIVTNGQGGRVCKDTATVFVPNDVVPPLALAGPPKIISCSQPQVQLQGTGSVGAQYTYFWVASNGGNIVSGSTTLNPVVNAVGSYKLRVTNNHNGCSASSTTTVSALTTPPTLNIVGGAYSCTNPTVTLQTTTNATNGDFSWSGPNGFVSSVQSPVVNVAGTYFLTITDGISGCSSTGSAVVIDNNDAPGASAASGAITCLVPNFGLNGVSNVGGSSFSWTGPNGFVSTLPNPAVNVAGNYNLVVTGANGCTSTATAVVTLNNSAPGASLSVSGNLNCNNSTVNLISTSTAPAASLQHIWTLPNGNKDTTGTVSVLVTSLAGAYQVLVTNTTSGCTSTASGTVVQFAPVSANIINQVNPVCFGQNTGSLTANAGGGNGNYTYQWNNNVNTALNNGLGNGEYTVTITDGENCTATSVSTVASPPELNANTSATAQSANGTIDGTATASPSGGVPGYTYLWSTTETTASIASLAPGFYTVTVTDASGCSNVAIATVNPYNCQFLATIQAENISCFGLTDGSASVNLDNGTAPYQYLWSTGALSSTISNLSAGSYTVSVVDAANCPQLLLFDIVEPELLVLLLSSTEASGPNAQNGTANALVTGGSGVYTYLWSNSGSTASITGLAGGLYTVTVTDENGCSAVQTIEVAVGNCGLESNFLSVSPLCFGAATGEATVVLNGGSPPFTYAWSSGGSQSTESGLTAGTYTVSITDVNGCQITNSIELTQPTELVGTIGDVQNTSCLDAPEGSASVSFTGGVGAINIVWSNGQVGPNATGLVAGTVTATATDANGCSSSTSVLIEAVDNIAPTIVVEALDVPLGVSGTVTLTPQNLNATITDNCLISSITITPNTFGCTDLGPHFITITALDNSGNLALDTLTINIVDNASPVLVCPPSIIRCTGNTQVVYPGPTATDNCLGVGGNFSLVAGLPSGSIFPEGTTTTVFSYTDGQGNTGFCSFEVTILTPLSLELDTILPEYGDQNVGGILITVSGSLSPYSYAWTQNGQPFAGNIEDLGGITNGSYQVVVTDANGCSLTSGVFVVDSLVNTQQIDLSSLVAVYPNPTSGMITVVLPDEISGTDTHFIIFDISGKKVLEQQFSQQKQINFDLSRFSDGLYTILIQSRQLQTVRKIILNK